MSVTIHLRPATDDQRESYGVLFESETVHTVTGRGVHNRHHPHRIQVWENRPSKARDADPNVIVDPHGQPTEERYSYLTSAEAIVISAHPQKCDPEGAVLAIGDVIVELSIGGYVIGEFTLDPGHLRNPHLTPIEKVAAH